MYAFSFVLANFGMAMAARIPMITTTMRSSIRVNPDSHRRMASSCWFIHTGAVRLYPTAPAVHPHGLSSSLLAGGLTFGRRCPHRGGHAPTHRDAAAPGGPRGGP